MHRRALGKSTDELVEKFFGADLEMEGVSAVLDTNVEELCHGELDAGRTRQHIVR